MRIFKYVLEIKDKNEIWDLSKMKIARERYIELTKAVTISNYDEYWKSVWSCLNAGLAAIRILEDQLISKKEEK